jgi:hypothetical protein
MFTTGFGDMEQRLIREYIEDISSVLSSNNCKLQAALCLQRTSVEEQQNCKVRGQPEMQTPENHRESYQPLDSNMTPLAFSMQVLSGR